ncbi:MAG: B-box zinc finger protein, partial [Chloroflexia bacterium]
MQTKDFSEYDSEIPVYCANHPGVPTYLRCGKCEKPICAKCRVSTPAGFRCYQCANLSVLPTYAVSTNVYIKGAVGGLIAAAITGVLMGLFPGFEFWFALAMGIAVPEAVAFAANQKRGPGLRAVAMTAVVFGFIAGQFVLRQNWWIN